MAFLATHSGKQYLFTWLGFSNEQRSLTCGTEAIIWVPGGLVGAGCSPRLVHPAVLHFPWCNAGLGLEGLQAGGGFDRECSERMASVLGIRSENCK